MAKYVYPAVFTPDGERYSINFLDLEGCFTCGDSLQDGLELARDVLALVLYGYEKDGKYIPEPSDRASVKIKENEFVNYIVGDTMEYRKRYNNKAVKKTLTLPEWLNEEAMALGINFSQVLQEALLQRLSYK